MAPLIGTNTKRTTKCIFSSLLCEEFQGHAFTLHMKRIHTVTTALILFYLFYSTNTHFTISLCYFIITKLHTHLSII